MKLLVIFGLLFAYAQGTSPPITVQQLQANAISHCVTEQGIDETKVKTILKNHLLPEDDDEFTKFFVCYWTQALVLKDGIIDNLHIISSLPALIPQLNKNIADSDFSKVAEASIDNCQEVIQNSKSTIGVLGIKYRNCIMQYIVNYH